MDDVPQYAPSLLRAAYTAWTFGEVLHDIHRRRAERSPHDDFVAVRCAVCNALHGRDRSRDGRPVCVQCYHYPR